MNDQGPLYFQGATIMAKAFSMVGIDSPPAKMSQTKSPGQKVRDVLRDIRHAARAEAFQALADKPSKPRKKAKSDKTAKMREVIERQTTPRVRKPRKNNYTSEQLTDGTNKFLMAQEAQGRRYKSALDGPVGTTSLGPTWLRK